METFEDMRELFDDGWTFAEAYREVFDGDAWHVVDAFEAWADWEATA